MADITSRLRAVALLTAAVTAVTACDTTAQFAPSLPAAAGFRVDGGVLKLWTGTPCQGVVGMTTVFDAGTTQSTSQVWTAPQPGVPLERADLLPATDDGQLRVEQPLPAGYDWTKAASLTFYLNGPKANGALVGIPRLLRESGQHPPDSYLFGELGWLTAADVQRENKKSFLTICTPDPD